mmetsp:Transcript_41597/g.76047  ORF Transcript_41597/g.76047 Transcript_41597/m.76047 type:complete len:361 (-) Transcript_41597:34-1116(-)
MQPEVTLNAYKVKGLDGHTGATTPETEAEHELSTTPDTTCGAPEPRTQARGGDDISDIPTEETRVPNTTSVVPSYAERGQDVGIGASGRRMLQAEAELRFTALDSNYGGDLELPLRMPQLPFASRLAVDISDCNNNQEEPKSVVAQGSMEKMPCQPPLVMNVKQQDVYIEGEHSEDQQGNCLSRRLCTPDAIADVRESYATNYKKMMALERSHCKAGVAQDYTHPTRSESSETWPHEEGARQVALLIDHAAWRQDEEKQELEEERFAAEQLADSPRELEVCAGASCRMMTPFGGPVGGERPSEDEAMKDLLAFVGGTNDEALRFILNPEARQLYQSSARAAPPAATSSSNTAKPKFPLSL